MAYWMRWRVALVVVVVAGLWSTRARAVSVPSQDLASLAFESKTIIVAHRIGKKAFVVDRSLAGNLQPGARVEVDTDGYWLHLAPALLRSAEYVLFLIHPRDATLPAWLLVDLRVIAGGHVYRFYQSSSEGPFEGILAGRGPSPLKDTPPAVPPVPPDVFFSDLSRAIEHARQTQRTLAEPPSAARTARLLDLIGPPLRRSDAPPGVLHTFFGYENGLAMAILEAFDKAGDLDALLEGFARVHGDVEEDDFEPELSAAVLIRAAASAKRPLRQRLAALLALGAESGPDVDARNALAELKLLGDPDPEVRALACRSGLYVPEIRKRLRFELMERWRVEKDPRVLIEFARAAENLDVLSRLGMPRLHQPIAWARHGRHTLVVEWWGERFWKPRSVTVEWRVHGQSHVSGNLARAPRMSMDEHVASLSAPFEFTDDLVGSGEACAFLELGHGRTVEKRTVPLVGEPAWCPVARAVAPRRSTIPKPPPGQRPPPGCGCALPLDSGGGLPHELIALIAGLGLLLLRRRDG